MCPDYSHTSCVCVDPTAELQVARRKIQQLEEVNRGWWGDQGEAPVISGMYWFPQWEKLQRHSEEVRERAETAECQIAAISQEYRKLIQEKDVYTHKKCYSETSE